MTATPSLGTAGNIESPPAAVWPAFLQRAIAVAAICFLAFAIWKLSGVLVAVFAAILLAIALRGCAAFLAKTLGVRISVGLTATIVLGVAVAGVITWLFGTIISEQFDE